MNCRIIPQSKSGMWPWKWMSGSVAVGLTPKKMKNSNRKERRKAILELVDTALAVVENNELGANFDGLDLLHCTDSTVRANSASGCGNVGIHLLDSSRNTIEGHPG